MGRRNLFAAFIIFMGLIFPLKVEGLPNDATAHFYGYMKEQIVLVIVGIVVFLIFLLLLLNLKKKTKVFAKANEKLANYSELWETFLNANTRMVYLKDEHLKYVFVNEAAENYFQIKPREMIGHEDSELLSPELVEMNKKLDLYALEKQQMIEDTISWRDRFYKITKFPVRMLNGQYGVGSYITDITEEREYQDDQVRMMKRNKLLLEVLNRSFSSKQEQLDYVLNQLLGLSGSQYGYIYFYDEEKEEFTFNSWTGGGLEECKVQGAPKVYKLENTGIWGEVVRQRRYIVVNDFLKPNPLKKGYPKGHVELTNFMSVPVLIDDKIVAVVGFGNKPGGYNETDVYEMTLLMSGVWNAVQRRESMETLAYERSKYLQTLISIGDGVMVVDRNGRIEILNLIAAGLTGWKPEEAIGKHYKDVFILSHEQEGFTIDDPIEKVFLTREGQQLGNHAILTSRDGSKYHLEDSAAPVWDDKNSLAGVVLVFRDVTEKKEQRTKIEYMSFHDSLTGLYNRRFFEEEMRRIDTERNLPISIIMGDVNSLKLTNDVFGHAFGDMLLERVAEVMQNTCRGDDIIARWGGDEFVVLLPRTGYQEAGEIAARIRKGVAEQQIRAIRGSISIGYETKTKLDEEIVETLSDAEANMYLIKTLERSYVQGLALNAIIDDISNRSEWEKFHGKRVGDLCQKLGKALYLPEPEIQRLGEAGRFHDIGKVVQDNEMHQHPVIGYRILHAFSDTRDLAEAVLAHHENWDGSGYPKGLEGEEIPLFARVIAVAEAYDRIMYSTNDTCTGDLNFAIQKIKQGKGTQFDPEIIETFIKMPGFESQG